MDHGIFMRIGGSSSLLLVLWLAVSSELERVWGAYRLVFLYVVIAPISASLLLIARSAYPGFGLVPLLMGAAGALNASSHPSGCIGGYGIYGRGLLVGGAAVAAYLAQLPCGWSMRSAELFLFSSN